MRLIINLNYLLLIVIQPNICSLLYLLLRVTFFNFIGPCKICNCIVLSLCGIGPG